jgi:hypothetical protein
VRAAQSKLSYTLYLRVTQRHGILDRRAPHAGCCRHARTAHANVCVSACSDASCAFARPTTHAHSRGASPAQACDRFSRRALLFAETFSSNDTD